MATREYGLADRLVHRLALSSHLMRRLAFDIDCLTLGAPKSETLPKAPVYVCGLARAGTTILLEALHSTGEFATLTYRNMPFITAPSLWSRFSSGRRTGMQAKERAHGDRLLVDYDSPEAFEEVFWIMLTEASHVGADRLHLHAVGPEGLAEYRRYVSNIVRSAHNSQCRYLAKNNNNLLRLASVRAAFKDAVILVPFRHPVEHADSLLRQHRRFIESQAQDGFELDYMGWLGHFEFGRDMKPFLTESTALPASEEETHTLEYWLRYWTAVYSYVLKKHAGHVVFVDHAQLCAQPSEVLARLSDVVQLSFARLSPFADRFVAPRGNSTLHSDIPHATRHVYEALVAAAI